MADITPNQINAATGKTIFVADSNGDAAISLAALTGDSVGMDANLNEAMLKLMKACTDTAEAQFQADNANDARSSYPAATRTPTTAEGAPILQYRATVVGKVVITDSLDNVVAV